jgi:hypothetical protein
MVTDEMRELTAGEIEEVSGGGGCTSGCYNQCSQCTKNPAVTPSYNPSPTDMRQG